MLLVDSQISTQFLFAGLFKSPFASFHQSLFSQLEVCLRNQNKNNCYQIKSNNEAITCILELVSDDYFRQVAMEVLLATELDDKSAARGSLDLTYLDDIPEERALGSGKSSEEKEITRLDSGLGEWDSESSRKTSFSSQGRLSPDFAMAKVTVDSHQASQTLCGFNFIPSCWY